LVFKVLENKERIGMTNSRPSVWDYLTNNDLENDKEDIKKSFASHIEYTIAKDEYSVTDLDFFQGIAFSVRDRLIDKWNKTQQSYYNKKEKRIYYLSLEFLIGRLLEDSLINLGILEPTKDALKDLRIEYQKLVMQESDAGLGNGGLGRLAACFMDSMATMSIPAMGYGIRYEYGLFRQGIQDGKQIEIPDNWLKFGWPWEVPRMESIYTIQFGGSVEQYIKENKLCHRWINTQNVMAMAYDIFIPGYKNETVNTLRLWGAKASNEFDFANFNRGDYFAAVSDKNTSENISRVLYPNDAFFSGRTLRLKQEYFFVSATLQDAIRRHLKEYKNERESLSVLPERAIFQLNDTHPALAIAEMMHILIDNFDYDWDAAWEITKKSFAYTNHTVLPEALEQWPVSLFQELLPRHLQIIYEINRRLLDEICKKFPGDEDRLRRMSLIDEDSGRLIRMSHLAIVGSKSINGVSKLHSDIVKNRLFKDFYEIYPKRFNNKTNGITQRRWLLKCNPELAKLITTKIGDGWIKDLDHIKNIEKLSEEKEFQDSWRRIKIENKRRLSIEIKKILGIDVNPNTIFDVQIKRIHEYKRQMLNILHAIKCYRDIKRKRGILHAPRTIIFAGKAAPGYEMAKRIIQLIVAVGNCINNDPDVNSQLKVVFIPDYRVSLAEIIVTAADLSEQISTAGMEASGTGNMKLALNGALTIGTLDGANVEILEAVGEENIFIFGKKAQEVQEIKKKGYKPRDIFDSNQELQEIIHLIAFGDMSPKDRTAFWPIVENLLDKGDNYLVLADFESYINQQLKVDSLYLKQFEWTKKSILNTANMGRFSSDRTIREYDQEIWRVNS
jgi:starch phosphorylase